MRRRERLVFRDFLRDALRLLGVGSGEYVGVVPYLAKRFLYTEFGISYPFAGVGAFIGFGAEYATVFCCWGVAAAVVKVVTGAFCAGLFAVGAFAL